MVKPGRRIFDHVSGSLALDLQHALFIDDHAVNVGAACGFGWNARQFHNASQREADLAADGWLSQRG